eukprot:scaffold23.g4156.t1
MTEAGLSKAAQDAFKQNYEQLVAGVTGLLPESEIEPVADLPRLESLHTAAAGADIKALLRQTAVLKLNGGLGTSMGLEKAKSLLVVKDGKTFLDLIAEQIKYTRQNYLFVSNSDNLGATLDLDLLAYFASSDSAFLMEVCEREQSDKKGGHLARHRDGRLILRESAQCPDADKAAFEDVSKHRFFNTNNLWVNLRKLKATLEARAGRRARAPRSAGGAPRGGRSGAGAGPRAAAAPAPEASGGVLKLPLIKNKKTVNPRDASTEPVFQLETAMGSAIECFEDAGAVVVPRSRFAPVKTCSDLFALRRRAGSSWAAAARAEQLSLGDAYRVTEASTVVLAAPQPPLIKLDDKHYKLVDQMQALTRAVPSLISATSLTVKGPVSFGPRLVLKGEVTITNAAAEPAPLEGRTLEDESVTLGG